MGSWFLSIVTRLHGTEEYSKTELWWECVIGGWGGGLRVSPPGSQRTEVGVKIAFKGRTPVPYFLSAGWPSQ